jgi:hypothetical protein
MDTVTLALTITSVLGPYLSAGAKKAAEKVGEKSVEALSKFWSYLKGEHAKDPAASSIVAAFETAPAQNEQKMTDLLARSFETSPELREQAQNLTGELGGSITMFQQLGLVYGEATAAELDSGAAAGLSLNVTQTAANVAPTGRVTGLRIGGPRRTSQE